MATWKPWNARARGYQGREGVDEIFCLGDIIGYGPNPGECIDRVGETCKVTLLGNHDHGAMSDPDGFKIGAERAIFGTREGLDSSTDKINTAGAGSFCDSFRNLIVSDSHLFVHGSPRNPLSEYIFPEDIYNRRKMERLFELVTRYCFHGHTHVPGIITENFQFFSPDEIDGQYNLGGEKLLIDVGSVGQPRDGDNRACYVIFEDGLAEKTLGGQSEPERLASVRRPE